MRFDTLEFWLFFGVAWCVFHGTGRRKGVLLAASYLFYASAGIGYLGLLVLSTCIDFVAARAIARRALRGPKRSLLLLSVCANLGILGYFKYANFALDNLRWCGMWDATWMGSLYVSSVIPLGISFYTFQTMSYTLDVYRGRVDARTNFLDFALYVSFLPQLVAGPIVRAADFFPQIARIARIARRGFFDGAELCLVGLFQKVVIADNLGVVVDACYGSPDEYSGMSLLVASLAFSVQIYCDFSAYTTIARGLGKLFGIELPENFGYPLLAGTPLTRRAAWHITMALWFRDYVYRPLGGDRRGTWVFVRNTLILWLLFGLWHGPSWNFVCWGGLNGLIILAYHAVMPHRWVPADWRGTGLRALGVILVHASTVANTIVFRGASLEVSGTIFERIVGWSGGIDVSRGWLCGVAAFYVGHLLSRRYYRAGWMADAPTSVVCCWIGAVLSTIALFARDSEPFYYFKF